MKRTKISVALAAFNGATWIQDQLYSLAGQSLLPDEVVVSDDRSEDDTLVRVLEARSSLPFRLTVLTNRTRVGYAQNFHRALRGCTGSIIFLCDQDDYWFPNKIERMVEILGEHKALLAIHDLQMTDSELHVYPYTMLERLNLLGYSAETHIKGCATVLRRELLESALPIPEDFPHDTWFHAIAAHLKSRVVLREPLMYYRRHEVNTSRFPPNTLNPKWIDSHVLAIVARAQQHAFGALANALSSEESLNKQLLRLQQVREAIVRYGLRHPEAETNLALESVDGEIANLFARLRTRHSKYGIGPMIRTMHRIRRTV